MLLERQAAAGLGARRVASESASGHAWAPQRCRRIPVRARTQAVSTTVAPALTTTTKTIRGSRKDLAALERQVLDTLASVKGRGKSGLTQEQRQALASAFDALEADGGLPDPTTLPALSGKWRLLFTSRPGTASPIQNTFTGVEAFSVYQEVDLEGPDPRVNNLVEFGTSGQLKVEAQASTETRPLAGFTPRNDKGDFLFGIFGRSSTYNPVRPNSRIWFQFDKAAFSFVFLPFKVPYPVPFRLLGDERKGFIDVTYMNADATFRLSRGNKGTLFVLVKDVPLKERLAVAIASGDDELVLALIDQLAAAGGGVAAPARSAAAGGTWRLVWSQQAKGAGALQKFGTAQANSFQIIDADSGTLENLVDLGFLRIFARATVAAASDTRTSVAVNQTGFILGQGVLPTPLTIPLPNPRGSDGQGEGWVDWLYLDEGLRVTRGNKGSLFIHVREDPV